MLEYKELSEVDLKLHLLSGSPIRVGNLIIEPYTLREIKDYGYIRFMETLQWGIIQKDDFINAIDDFDKREILKSMSHSLTNFDFYTVVFPNIYLGKLIDFMSLVFKTDDIKLINQNMIAIDFEKYGIIVFDEKNQTHYFNEEKFVEYDEKDLKIVTKDNFDEIVEVVKLQNCLQEVKKGDEYKFNPADEETRKLIEQMEKMRKKVEEIKEKQNEENNEPVTIYEIISAVTAKSNNINKFNVWDLTLYQLYDEYKRLQAIDNYDFSIKAIMAGAENVELKHWSSKL